MSHLLKKNKNILNILRYLISSIIIFSIVYAVLNFEGNKILLFLYAILINFIFYLSFHKNSSFYEFFFGILLWLGFWFKFFLVFIFTKNAMYEGLSLNFINLSSSDKINILNNALITSCFAFIGYILASFLTKQLLKNTTYYFDHNDNFLIRFQKLFIFLIIILIIFISYFNIENLIYQRGMISRSDFPFYVNGIIKWLLLFGFSSIISIFIFYNLKNKKLLYFLSFFSIIEASISNLSYLSRASIFNTFSVFFGIYKSNKFFKLNLNLKYFITYFFLIIFFFLVTSSAVNLMRTYYFNFADNNDIKLEFNVESKSLEFKEGDVVVVDNYNNLNKAFIEILSLVGNRWVGIDAVISVENYKNKSFLLFYNSFFENFNSKELAYYERIIHQDTKNLNSLTYGIKTPGLVGFLYFTGSKFFLFMSIFIITFCFICFEKYIRRILLNPIFCCLIMQVIAYRFAHFGYLPKQSYLLFGSIILTILIHYIFSKIFVKKINHK